MADTLKATRDGFGEGLLELGEKDPRVVVLVADLKETMRVSEFAKKYPERFIECGVAEQNMVGVAAGLAACGKIPFAVSYAVFSPGRTWDQIRVSVCYPNLNVKIVGGHTGLSVGADGATHQALEDIALMRVLPNMTVVVPCDSIEARKATVAIVQRDGPGYLRLTRPGAQSITSEESRFEIGKAEILWDSENSKFEILNFKSNFKPQFSKLKHEVAIIGCGPILYECLLAAEQLHEEGIGSVVVNNHTIKPMDEKKILEVARECGAIVTVEEHQIAGGMGSAIAEILVSSLPAGRQVPMEFVGVRDSFGESGTPEELFGKYGLMTTDIMNAVKKVVGRKNK
jgi:transketolase